MDLFLNQDKEIELNQDNKHIIGQIVLWYCNDERFKGSMKKGLLLRGNCGTGKSLIVKHLADVVKHGDNKNPILIHAKEIQNAYQDKNEEEIKRLKERFLLIIDDLGTESVETKTYGNSNEPFIDLFDYRYRNTLETIIVTNLTPEKIKEVYGERILDRFKEAFNEYVFEYKSFRK